VDVEEVISQNKKQAHTRKNYSRGCSPVALGLRAQSGSRSEHPAANATLGAKHGDRRRHSRTLVNAAVVRQHDEWQHVIPLAWVPIDQDGQHVQERAVKPLCLSIPLWVVWEGSRLANAEEPAHLQHHRRFK
ncbi:hypothetical protein T03_12970, partial [Trichinella britovi]